MVAITAITIIAVLSLAGSAQAFAHGSAPSGFWHMVGDGLTVSVPIVAVIALVALYQSRTRSAWLTSLAAAQLLAAGIAVVNFHSFVVFMIAGTISFVCALLLIYGSARATSRREIRTRSVTHS